MKKIILVFAILFAACLNSSQAQGTWVQKADFGGIARWGTVGFSIGNKGYIGTGEGTDGYKKDFWEYDPTTETWTQKSDFEGTAKGGAAGFSIGNKGYIGTGLSDYKPLTIYNDFWEYDPAVNAWTQKANFGGTAREGSVGFSIGSKGYIGTGADNGAPGYKNDFWEYDPASDSWTQKADFGGTERFGAVGFSIASKGYIGMGGNSDIVNDFWEYDPATNAWTQKANFGGTARASSVGFSISNKGYIGAGWNYGLVNDFWEYDPATNGWTEKANFGGTGRYAAVGFSIGSKGYIGTGYNYGVFYNDFWQYTPESSSCDVPTNLIVTNITSSSAKLKWDAVAGAEGYKVRYKVAGTSAWTVKMTTGTSKTINGLSPNTAYKWEVQTFCETTPPHVKSDWSPMQEFTTPSLRMSDEEQQQVSFQIYPNPAQDHATIQFTLPQSSHVYIKVYDVSGKEIATLLNGDMEQGEHSLLLNTNQFSKGVYLVKMISDFGMMNEKLIVQ